MLDSPKKLVSKMKSSKSNMQLVRKTTNSYKNVTKSKSWKPSKITMKTLQEIKSNNTPQPATKVVRVP